MSTNERKITFVQDSAPPEPAEAAARLTFQSVFKKDYHNLRLQLKIGINNLRFLPRQANSRFSSWLASPVVFYWSIGGMDIIAPSTFATTSQRTMDAVVEARVWLYNNRRELMFNDGKRNNNPRNENGLKLFDKTNCAAWCIDRNAPQGQRLRLFWQSFSSGLTGGKVGLGFTLFKEAFKKNLDAGSPNFNKLVYGSIADPNSGRNVIIESTQGEGKYPVHDLQIAQEASALQPYMESLTQEELDLLCPPDDTFNVLSHAETIRQLGTVIPPDCMEQIFSNHSYFASYYREAYDIKGEATGLPATQALPTSKPKFEMAPATPAAPAAAPAAPVVNNPPPLPAATAKAEPATQAKPDLAGSPLQAEGAVSATVKNLEKAPTAKPEEKTEVKPAAPVEPAPAEGYTNSKVIQLMATEEGLNTLMENWPALTQPQRVMIREANKEGKA